MKPIGDRIFTGILLFIFALFILMAAGYDPAPRRIPLLVGVPGLALAAWHFVSILKRGGESAPEGGDAQVAKCQKVRYQQEALFLLWLAVFYLLSYLLGFTWSVPAFLFLLLYVYFRERIVLSIVYSAMVSFAIYLLFAVIFHINLYRGIIFILLRRANVL